MYYLLLGHLPFGGWHASLLGVTSSDFGEDGTNMSFVARALLGPVASLEINCYVTQQTGLSGVEVLFYDKIRPLGKILVARLKMLLPHQLKILPASLLFYGEIGKAQFQFATTIMLLRNIQ